MRWIFSLIMLGIFLAGCAGSANKARRAETHYLLGISYLQEQNPTLALREFLLAEEIDNRDVAVQAALGQAYQLKGAYPEAEKHYLRALKLRPDDPQTQNNLAALYLDMQRWDDAIRYFRRAADNLLFTRQALAQTGLGYAYLQQGDYLQAVSTLQKALAKNPRYLQAHFLLGEAYSALGKTEMALQEYRRATELSPQFVRAHLQAGLAHMKLDQSAAAAQAFREVLRLSPESEEAVKAAEYLKLLD